MGLIDRDYMHEKRRQRPFSPPPERFKLGTLGMVLVFVMALFFLYKAADWLLNQRAVQRVAQPAAEPASKFIPSPLPAQALAAQPAYQNRTGTTAGTSRVTKCVANGKTSYGDGSCAQGSISSQITTRADHNLIAPVRPQAVTSAEAPAMQPIVEVQTNSPSDAAVKMAECQSLEAQIERWDAMARQPLGAQTQDSIRDQRKKARDRQFQIRCR
jgi:hypothetical protein